jgi:hypothetical protein
MITTTIRSSIRVKPFLLRIIYPSVTLLGFYNRRPNYGAERVKTTGMLYVPGALLGCVKPAAQTVLKNTCAGAPLVAAAPDRKSASVLLMPT